MTDRSLNQIQTRQADPIRCQSSEKSKPISRTKSAYGYKPTNEYIDYAKEK